MDGDSFRIRAYQRPSDDPDAHQRRVRRRVPGKPPLDIPTEGEDGQLDDGDLWEVIVRAGVVALRALGKQKRYECCLEVIGDHADAVAAASAIDRLAPGIMAW